MDPQHRRLLNRRRITLLDSLKLEPILQVMEDSKILEESECRQIREMRGTKKQQNGAFLESLKRSGPNAFPVLVDILRIEQPSLAKLLSGDPGEDEVWSNPSSKGNSRQVSREGSSDHDVRPADVTEHLETIDQSQWDDLARPGAVQPVGMEPLQTVPMSEQLEYLQDKFQDCPVSQLSTDSRASLCRLLDRKHPFGDDWRRLYLLLGLPDDKLSIIEKDWNTTTDAAQAQAPVEGPTEQTLFVWQGRLGEHNATVYSLAHALLKMQRQDAVDIIAAVESEGS